MNDLAQEIRPYADDGMGLEEVVLGPCEAICNVTQVLVCLGLFEHGCVVVLDDDV